MRERHLSQLPWHVMLLCPSRKGAAEAVNGGVGNPEFAQQVLQAL
jgi:hypothetical protein